MPHVTGSSLGSKIQATEIKFRGIYGTYLGIPFGPLYPKIYQFFLGVLFRDELWKRQEP